MRSLLLLLYTWRMPNITFVDKDDRIIGYGSKIEAISRGITHRIVRVFVFNSRGQLLIQKRSPSVAIPNRWDQSAAGHVDEGEDYAQAARRELQEEVGIIDTTLAGVAKYYSEEIDDSITKKRFNMLYETTYDGEITMDKNEVSEVMWLEPQKLNQWMEEKPEDFTQGFLLSYRHFLNPSPPSA